MNKCPQERAHICTHSSACVHTHTHCTLLVHMHVHTMRMYTCTHISAHLHTHTRSACTHIYTQHTHGHTCACVQTRIHTICILAEKLNLGCSAPVILVLWNGRSPPPSLRFMFEILHAFRPADPTTDNRSVVTIISALSLVGGGMERPGWQGHRHTGAGLLPGEK